MSLVGASWYLSAMLMAMAILYPILRKHTETFLYIIAPLTAIFILGWFAIQHGHLQYTFDFEGGVCLGLLRGIAEICAGCFCFQIGQKLKDCFDDKKSVLWTLLEFAGFGTALYVATHFHRSETDFPAILAMMIGIVMSFSGKSYTNVWLRRVNVRWISGFSLALYLNHLVWVKCLQRWRLLISWPQETALLVFLSFLTATTCFFTVNAVTAWVARRRKPDSGNA